MVEIPPMFGKLVDGGSYFSFTLSSRYENEDVVCNTIRGNSYKKSHNVSKAIGCTIPKFTFKRKEDFNHPYGWFFIPLHTLINMYTNYIVPAMHGQMLRKPFVCGSFGTIC
jgi:hypothetical protein